MEFFRIYLFGGSFKSLRFNTLHQLDLASPSIKLVNVRGDIPPPTTYHSMVVIQQFLLLMGGHTDNGESNQIYLFYCPRNLWILPKVKGNVPRRRFHTLTTVSFNPKIAFPIGGCDERYHEIFKYVINQE